MNRVGVGGRLEQLRIRLSQLPTKLKLKLSLAVVGLLFTFWKSYYYKCWWESLAVKCKTMNPSYLTTFWSNQFGLWMGVFVKIFTQMKGLVSDNPHWASFMEFPNFPQSQIFQFYVCSPIIVIYLYLFHVTNILVMNSFQSNCLHKCRALSHSSPLVLCGGLQLHLHRPQLQHQLLHLLWDGEKVQDWTLLKLSRLLLQNKVLCGAGSRRCCNLIISFHIN